MSYASIAPYGQYTPGMMNYLPQNMVQGPGSQSPSMIPVTPGGLGSVFAGGVPAVGTSGGGGIFGGMNGLEIGQLGLSGLQTLGSLWGAWQSSKIAKKQLRLSEKFGMANLANQISSYNTSLEDRIRSRAATEGRDASYAENYLAEHKLKEVK